MKSLAIALILVTSSISLAAKKKGQKDFFCPTADKNPTLNEMYTPMQVGTVWGDDSIVFVDEERFLHEDADLKKPLTWVGQSFKRKKTSKKIDFRGTFKIGYQYRATECRRQIRIEKQNKDSKGKKIAGSYSGHTLIEICSPNIMGAFAQIKAGMKSKGAKGNDFQAHVYPQLEAKASEMETQASELYDKSYELYSQADDIHDEEIPEVEESAFCDDSSSSYDSDKCEEKIAELEAQADELYEKSYEIEEQAYQLEDSASSLFDLDTDGYDGKVHYLKDDEGFVVPRFAVDLDEVSFRRRMSDYYDKDSGDYKDDRVCDMKIKHGTSYAGLASSYTWTFGYNSPASSYVWYYDSKGITQRSKKKYVNDNPKNFWFTDWKEF